MKADHGNNMEKVGHVDSFYLSLISRIRFKNHQKLMIRGRLWRFRDTNRRSGLRWAWVGHPWVGQIVGPAQPLWARLWLSFHVRAGVAWCVLLVGISPSFQFWRGRGSPPHLSCTCVLLPKDKKMIQGLYRFRWPVSQIFIELKKGINQNQGIWSELWITWFDWHR